ncbi:MAG: glycosyltransferase family 39 protein [Promethearchaeota archaeon]
MKREYSILMLILILAFVLRFYGILTYLQLMPSGSSNLVELEGRSFREATYGMAAWRIVDGDIPYRDFFHAQAPLSPFLLAFVFLIFGVGVIQARLFLVFFTTFTCFMIFLAGKKIDYKTGLLGSLTFAVAPISVLYGMLAVNDFIAMTFCVIGYFFLTPVIMGYQDKRDSLTERNSLILAGFFTSVGVMVKIIVAPILIAFIVTLIAEGRLVEVDINDQIKNMFFLIIGFIIPLLVVFSPFYFLFGDDFLKQVLGQHVSKGSLSLEWNWRLLVEYLILENLFFFIFFVISAIWAARNSYGRGLLICILFMVFAIFFFIPRPYRNYYQMNILFMAMVCGFFPLPDFKSLNSKSMILNAAVIINLFLYKLYRYLNFNAAKLAYFEHYLAKIALTATLISLIAIIVILIKEKQFTKLKINDHVKNAFSSPYQILKGLKIILNKDVSRLIVVSAFIVIIATTGVSYPNPSESEKKTLKWIEDNTSSDDYILSDDLKINFRAKRRSPFAEISIDRTDLGELTGDMFIDACYEFDVRVVVNTGRLFGTYDTYNVFLEFLEEKYVPINEGYTIYVRTTSLQ